MAITPTTVTSQRVSGVIGTQLTGVKGWERGTTGVGGDVRIRLGHVQGVASYDMTTGAIEEPLRTGRFIFAWTRRPQFLHSDVIPFWDYFLQDKVKEVSGLSDNEVETISRTVGPVGRTDSYFGFYKEANQGFSIKVPEVKGSPLRKLLKYYVNGISDSVTGTAHFYGDATLRMSKINYGGDAIYILLGPSMRPDDIEFACMWFNAFTNKDLIGHLNSGELGEVGSVEDFELEFKGQYVSNDETTHIAQIITEAFGYYKDTREGVILPEYIYNDILNKSKLSDLKAQYGANVADKLARAAGVSAGLKTVLDARSNLSATDPVTITPDQRTGQDVTVPTVTPVTK